MADRYGPGTGPRRDRASVRQPGWKARGPAAPYDHPASERGAGAETTGGFTTAGGRDVLEPQFTFHGFRYAEISGLSGDLSPVSATACVVHSDTPRTGFFECSSPDVNRLFGNIDWGQRGNFVSIPTDCPQPDERLRWLGDAQIFARTAAYNRDVASFFSKWLDDVTDAQLPSGAFTDFAPRLGCDWEAAPAWGDAGIIVPWTIYKM